MHFICPKCDRPLTKPNSWHYCKKASIADLFTNKPSVLKILFDKLYGEVGQWKGVSASATKTCVVFIATRTFLVVKVMKQALELKFVLPEESDEFPIYKRQLYGKKAEHYIRLHDEGDLDKDVIRLLHKSYVFMTA